MRCESAARHRLTWMPLTRILVGLQPGFPAVNWPNSQKPKKISVAQALPASFSQRHGMTRA